MIIIDGITNSFNVYSFLIISFLKTILFFYTVIKIVHKMNLSKLFNAYIKKKGKAKLWFSVC